MIGILGGSFDPIHIGHIHLALEVMEKRGLKNILFCPAKQNPLKDHSPFATTDERFLMIEKALENVPNCSLYKEEALREGPSFAYKTLELLHENSEEKIAYIVSDETVLDFSQWKKPEKILELATLLVGSRNCEGSFLEKLKGDPKIYEAAKAGWTKTLRLDVSSSLIRKRLKNGLYCGHLLPGKVVDFIFENKLYYVG